MHLLGDLRTLCADSCTGRHVRRGGSGDASSELPMRAAKPVFELFLSRWLRDLLDGLPKVVARTHTQAKPRSGTSA